MYLAQKLNPTEGDYSKLVIDDFSMIKEEINEYAIIAMTEEQYKNYRKKHIKKSAFKHLSETQTSHSKVRDIHYENSWLSPI